MPSGCHCGFSAPRTADRVPEQGELREKPVRAPVRARRRPYPSAWARFPQPNAATASSTARRADGGDSTIFGSRPGTGSRLMRRPKTPAAYRERRSDDPDYPRGGSATSGEPGRARPSTRPSTHHTAAAWLCIHRYERNPTQGWRTRTGNGYYGGLQMDIGFQRAYGPSSCAARARPTTGRRSSRCGSPSARTAAAAGSTRGRTRARVLRPDLGPAARRRRCPRGLARRSRSQTAKKIAAIGERRPAPRRSRRRYRRGRA